MLVRKSEVVPGKAHRTVHSDSFLPKNRKSENKAIDNNKKEIYASITKTDMQSIGVLVPL